MANLEPIVELMLDVVPHGVRPQLTEDPVAAIPAQFPPARVVALSAGTGPGSDACSCDGYYDDQIVPGVPHLLYLGGRSPRRVRFTVLHELGHLVVRHLEPELLDLLDDAAGVDGDVEQLEERACHRFAGRLLISDELLDEVINGGCVSPAHLIELYMTRRASWEAAAVRLAGRIKGQGAVVVVRSAGAVGFAVSAPSLGSWWPRGSALDPSGPLTKATTRPCRAQPDTFRYDLPGALRLWCDILQPWPGLGVAVMAERPSDGRLNILPPGDEEWARLYCLRCGELREGDWCFDCKGARCEECGACGCYRRAPERLCEGGCGLLKGFGAFDKGSEVCRDCLDA